MTTRDDGYVAISHTVEDDDDEVTILPAARHLEQTTSYTRPAPHNGKLIISSDDDGEHHYTYAYGPPGLAGLKHNRYALMCAIFASIGGLEFGYDQGVIANVLVMKDFMQRWPVTSLQKGLMTAVLELGALLGALSAGIYADRFSRGQAILVACGVFILGALFQCGATHLTHIFFGRAVGGIGVGALSMLTPLYISEISPPEVRGSLMALEQFSIVLGVVLGFWTGFVTRDIDSSLSWRIPLFLQLPPALLLAAGALLLPPSPRLLVLRGKPDDAHKSLARLRGRTEIEAEGDVLLQIELLEMRVENELVRRASHDDTRHPSMKKELRAWKHLLEPKYKARTMVGVLIMVFQQWSGINALLYYGPTLVRALGLPGHTVSLLVAGGIGIVQLLAVIPAIAYIDRVGRKPLLKAGSAVMSLSHISIAVLVFLFQSSWEAHPAAAWSAVICIYIFTAAYGISFGPIGWVLPSEVFPLSMRSKGVALSTMSNWFNNFIIGLITPVLMDFSPTTTFLIFASACILAFLWSTYYVPETANVSLEEIDEVFKSEVGREDVRLKAEIEEELGLRGLIRELADD